VTLLSRPWALHDIADVESFCTGIATRSRLELSYHDREELTAFLIAECWQLSLRYEAGRGSTTSFIGWATTNLRLRCVDWQRKRFGRTRWTFSGHVYERPRPQLLSLDELDPGHDRMGQPLGAGLGDPAADSTPAFAGLHTAGDRQRARDLETLGLTPRRRAPD
jgi:hypothetical protein